MSHHLKFAVHLFRHKWFVLRAGLRLKVPLWRLLIHDLTKLLPSEWRGHAQYQFGLRTETSRLAFYRAARAHHERNKHHWQKWAVIYASQPDDDPFVHHWPYALIRDNGTIVCSKCGVALQSKLHGMEIPDNYIREMVADWAGSRRARHGTWDIDAWWEEHGQLITLGRETRQRVEILVSRLAASFSKGTR